MIETRKFKNRFTDEEVLTVRFTGKQDQLIDILDWVIDNGGRAQGNIRADEGLDLMVHESGIGLIKVKPGESIVKSESGFEVHSPITFPQVYTKVSSIIQVIEKPVVLEAIQFDGSKQNEIDISQWLSESKFVGKFKHTIPGTARTYYRIEFVETKGLIDILLNNWIVKSGNELLSLTNDEFLSTYQKVG